MEPAARRDLVQQMLAAHQWTPDEIERCIDPVDWTRLLADPTISVAHAPSDESSHPAAIDSAAASEALATRLS